MNFHAMSVVMHNFADVFNVYAKFKFLCCVQFVISQPFHFERLVEWFVVLVLLQDQQRHKNSVSNENILTHSFEGTDHNGSMFPHMFAASFTHKVT